MRSLQNHGDCCVDFQEKKKIHLFRIIFTRATGLKECDNWTIYENDL